MMSKYQMNEMFQLGGHDIIVVITKLHNDSDYNETKMQWSWCWHLSDFCGNSAFFENLTAGQTLE